jgi:hypothetical protein
LPHCQHVPPLPYFPTSTVCSSLGPAGLLHPASDHGVRSVLSRIANVVRQRQSSDPPLERGSLPFEAFPSVAGVVPSPHHKMRSPTPLPLSSLDSAGFAVQREAELPMVPRPQGFDPPQSPLPPRPIAETSWPDAPLGFLGFWPSPPAAPKDCESPTAETVNLPQHRSACSARRPSRTTSCEVMP